MIVALGQSQKYMRTGGCPGIFPWPLPHLRPRSVLPSHFFHVSGPIKYTYTHTRARDRPYPDMSNVADAARDTDVLVINTGLHYLDAGLYRKVIRDMLETLLPFSKTKVLVWRETTAQHVNSDGGEWPPSECKGLSVDDCACSSEWIRISLTLPSE